MTPELPDPRHGDPTDGEHIRDGYAVVRVRTPLGERVPIRSGSLFDATIPLTEGRHWADLHDVRHGDADDELPLHPYWGAGQFYARIRDTGDTQGRQMQVLEACVGSHITVDCADCVTNAADRAMLGVDTLLDTLEQAYTFAEMRPVNVKNRTGTGGRLWFSATRFDAASDEPVGDTQEFTAEPAPPSTADSADASAPARFSIATFAFARRAEIALFIDFVADAVRMEGFHQHASGALTLAAQASETLLDLVLMHMLWWDGVTPEDGAQDFKPGVVSRVKEIENFAVRLGGSWDGSTGPVARWKSQVADPRNRVVHGGRHATQSEAEESIAATLGLYEYLLKLADGEKARGGYPALLGLLVAGDPSQLRTGRQRKAAALYFDLTTESTFRFARWRAIAARQRSILNGNPVRPAITVPEFLAVFDHRGVAGWYIVDQDSFYAIEIEQPDIAEDDLAAMAAEHLRRGGGRPGAFSFEMDTMPSPKAGAAWRDARELPGVETACTIAARFARRR